MFLLPSRLRKLFEKEPGEEQARRFESNVSVSGLAGAYAHPEEAGQDQPDRQTRSQEFDVFPADPSARKPWFSLSIREREVVALVCVGYRNYEIAAMLGIGYGTIQTHLQKIFSKFGLRSRKEIRAALKSWPAEEWWGIHH